MSVSHYQLSTPNLGITFGMGTKAYALLVTSNKPPRRAPCLTNTRPSETYMTSPAQYGTSEDTEELESHTAKQIPSETHLRSFACTVYSSDFME